MKFLTLACLTGLLILGGCANIGVDDSSTVAASTVPPAPTTVPAPAPEEPGHTPEFPTESMKPVTATEASSQAIASLTAPVDLWERIRRGFAMPDLDSELVHDREQWYAARPDDIFNMTERSRKYLFHIVEELERRNMPTELALLPFIESAFNPQAVSSAKAAGMWQFIPSTGKRYLLKQNAFRDDRRDVLASTRAALDYLQTLHDMFDDWHLALAAYNWGEGSVSRAIAKNQRKHLGTDYLDLAMPMETRFYIPKLLAMKNIVADPARFGVQLPRIDNHPYFDTVIIRRDIDVALAAKLAEVPLEDFKALNPSLSRPVILAAGMPQILLPWDNAAIFQRNLQAFPGMRTASWTVWIAPTTMKPADAAKRVNMSEADLRYVNRIPQNMMIRAGSTLLVPRPAGLSRDVTLRIADNGQLSLSREVVLRRTVIKAGKNDTVASIAKRYRVNAASVADWNKVSTSASFKPEQHVVMYLPVQHNRGARKPSRPGTKLASHGKPANTKATQVARR
jgi:membrane-bound lytic murein transglycosylase D